jgi:hypothetical protein
MQPVKSNLQEAYLRRLRGFERTNPGAFRFLTRLERDGPEHGLWLSTATNVHLYKEHAFLAYIQLSTSASKPSSLLLSSQFNNTMAADTIDRSDLLFPRPIKQLVMASSGFRLGWASAPADVIELKANTPDAFYDALMGVLQALDVGSHATSA